MIVHYERSKAVADTNPSAENVRAMLTETLGRLRKASEEYFGLLEKGLSSSPLPIADQAKQFCTAYGDDSARPESPRGGAEALLTKPIDFVALRSEIDSRVAGAGVEVR